MTEQSKKPPENTRWIMGNHHLPQNYGKAEFLITNDGKSKTITLEGRKRQTLGALMQNPLYCASPIRLSDNVSILKNEWGVDIHTEFYDDNSGPIPARFGVYFLKSKVEFMGEISPTKGEAA